VQGAVSGGTVFLDNGLNCAQNVRSALCRLGRTPYDFEEVLDFGCGCGRILRWFREVPDSCHIHGCDIDARAVAWCDRHLPFGEFKVNAEDPPLPYEEGSFDLILSLSVIDHLDAPDQEKWLIELKRVARPGAVLLVTFMGRTAQRFLKKAMRERIESEGFLFLIRMTGRFKLDGLPDAYQTAFQTKEHALALCSRHFTVKDYVEGGLGNLEDMAILGA
jgi:SAM-dependent methyltransferase